MGTTTAEAIKLVQSFAQAGISQFLARRGDLPEDDSRDVADMPHAVDLVKLLQRLRDEGSAIERVAEGLDTSLGLNPKKFDIGEPLLKLKKR